MSKKEKAKNFRGKELNHGFCARCGGYVLGQKGECRPCELYDLTRQRLWMYADSIESAKAANNANNAALWEIAKAIRESK